MRSLALSISMLSLTASYSGKEWIRFAVMVFNFAVFIFILVRVSKKGVNAFLKRRREQYLEELKQARAAWEEAERLLAEAKEKMERVDEEAKALIEDAKKRAEAMADEIIRTAELSAKKIVEEARNAAKAEADRVFADMRREIISQAVAEAERLLKERMTRETDERLVSEAIEGLVQDDRE